MALADESRYAVERESDLYELYRSWYQENDGSDSSTEVVNFPITIFVVGDSATMRYEEL